MDSAGGSCLSTPAAMEKCSGARCLVLEVRVFEDTEKESGGSSSDKVGSSSCTTY